MNKTLQALYNGEIFPAEQYRPMIEENVLRKKHQQHYEDFIQKLNNPLEKEFENIMNEQIDILSLEFSQAFTDGFRLGAKIIIEIYESEHEKNDES